MKLISHRGNTNGPIRTRENAPEYIDSSIRLGYDCEVDIWRIGDRLFSGHDSPTYEVSDSWITERANVLWIHCKNIEGLYYFTKNNNTNFFWHQNDDVTITSKGFLWTYPGKQLTVYSIAVLPEFESFKDINISYGICSDYIEAYNTYNI